LISDHLQTVNEQTKLEAPIIRGLLRRGRSNDADGQVDTGVKINEQRPQRYVSELPLVVC